MRAAWWLTVFAVLTLMTRTTFFSFAFTSKTTTTASYGLSRKNTKIRSLLAKQDNDDDKSGGALGKKAYNNDALFNFHMMTQAQKIQDYSAMDTFIDTNSLWNLAWHDSFVRNGLSDFVPPLTDSLNVLVVGGPGAASAQPETNQNAAVNDTIPTTTTAPISAATEEAAALETQAQDSSCSFLAAVFDDDKSGEDEKSSSALDDFVSSYDCIVDQGLIADLLVRGDHQFDDAGGTAASNNKEDMGRLLWEATKRIKDMGIYVASTPPLSDETKEYLIKLGQLLGLQWVFDLDGISDSNLSVNVARYSKYLKDELPPGWQSFSKLAKDVNK